MSFSVRHASHCGMTSIPTECDDEKDARATAAKRLRSYRRRGYPTTTLKRGEEWEILEPDGCQMIPDACGILWIEHEQHECPECGSAHETPEDAIACCDEPEDDWCEQDLRQQHQI